MGVKASREEVEDVVAEVIGAALGSGNGRAIGAEQSFEGDLGMPSVQVVQAIVAIQERLGVAPDRVVLALADVRTVGQLTDAMLRAARSEPATAPDDELMASLERARRRRARSPARE